MPHRDDGSRQAAEKHRSARSISAKAGIGKVKAHEFNDSSALYAACNFAALRVAFARDGYLLIRGLLPERRVTRAYHQLVTQLQQALPRSLRFKDGRLTAVEREGQPQVGLLQRQKLARSPQVLQILESPVLAELAANLLEGEHVKTTDFKWLRAVAKCHFTGLHTDRVFLGKNSDRLMTIWLPLHELGPQDGAMLVCSGSHRSRVFDGLRRSYGMSSVGADGTKSGWLTDDGSRLPNILRACRGNPCGIDWRTTQFAAGDVLVLHQDLLHMTASNESGSFRLSCDTRWQPAGHSANPALGSWRVIDPLEPHL